MNQAAGWVLLYQDAISQVWGRESRFGDERSADFIPQRKRRIGDQMPSGSVCWPALK